MKDANRSHAHRILSVLLLASVLALPLIGCGRSSQEPEPAVETGPVHPPARRPPSEIPKTAEPSEEQPENPPPGD